MSEKKKYSYLNDDDDSNDYAGKKNKVIHTISSIPEVSVMDEKKNIKRFY